MSHIRDPADSSRNTNAADPLAGHWDVLRRVVDRRVPACHVDDVLQDVALAAVKTEGLPADPTHRVHWLCRIALTQAALFWRKTARVKSTTTVQQEILDDQAGEEIDPVLWLIRQESAQQIDDALAALSTETRQVLLSKIVDGKTYAQIAQEFSISVDAAEYRVLAAKRALRSTILKHQNKESR